MVTYDIKARREALGMTQLELAQIVGVSEGTISRWESGDIKNMRRDKIYALANALSISPLAFIDVPPNEEIPEDEEPDVTAIARAGKKLTPEQRTNVLRYIRAFYPEAFDK